MPTDLPKNFHGSAPLGVTDQEAYAAHLERKAARKAARKLAYQSLWGIAKGLSLHYVVSLAGVAVIAAAGFHGVWRASVSATALGLLARWFLPNKARTKAAELHQQPQMGVMELTPDQLREFFADLPNQADLHDGAEAPSGPSPYM